MFSPFDEMSHSSGSRKATRSEKRMVKEGRIIKDKFVNNKGNRKPLVPLNDRQKEYINAIKQNSVVICFGKWGTSKTYIPAVLASDMLMDKEVEKVIIARPNEGKGKTIGLLPGGIEEKLASWCAPIIDTMKKRIGEGHYQAMLSNGKIELLSLESVKGRSWDDTFILVDEAEDIDPEVAKSLVGRQGVRSKLVVTGDLAQQDLKRNSGLQLLLDVADFANLPISVIDFDSWDYCVRSDEAKMWGMGFEAYENRRKNG